MKDTPTPRAAILDRITEAEVCEWMQARLAKANADYAHKTACLEICAWHDERTETTAHGLANGRICGIGHRKYSIESALDELARDISEKAPNPEKLRAEAAALIAEAEELEAEGAE